MSKKETFSPDLLRGSLDLMVLSVLADEPQYGYLIQQRLREASGGRMSVTAGTLYPILHRLEQDKLVKCRWESTTGRRRKWYELTAAGRRQLKQRAEQWYVYADCVRKLLEPAVTILPQTT